MRHLQDHNIFDDSGEKTGRIFVHYIIITLKRSTDRYVNTAVDHTTNLLRRVLCVRPFA